MLTTKYLWVAKVVVEEKHLSYLARPEPDDTLDCTKPKENLYDIIQQGHGNT